MNPLGLFALAAVPAVLALHLFRRRFRPRTVSALFLWDEPPDATPAGRRRERLERFLARRLEVPAAGAEGSLTEEGRKNEDALGV